MDAETIDAIYRGIEATPAADAALIRRDDPASARHTAVERMKFDGHRGEASSITKPGDEPR